MNKRQRKKKLQKSFDKRFSSQIRDILNMIADEYEKSLKNGEYPDLTDELSENLYNKILSRIDAQKITE
ncbi:MAG: hypothetical protein E7B11_21490 [Clostridiales bacterium]|nr:hypothetical protein [Clostridiales bacterium]MDU3243140.1 hypothetical protein [Clostridiales bacterium]